MMARLQKPSKKPQPERAVTANTDLRALARQERTNAAHKAPSTTGIDLRARRRQERADSSSTKAPPAQNQPQVSDVSLRARAERVEALETKAELGKLRQELTKQHRLMQSSSGDSVSTQQLKELRQQLAEQKGINRTNNASNDRVATLVQELSEQKRLNQTNQATMQEANKLKREVTQLRQELTKQHRLMQSSSGDSVSTQKLKEQLAEQKDIIVRSDSNVVCLESMLSIVQPQLIKLQRQRGRRLRNLTFALSQAAQSVVQLCVNLWRKSSTKFMQHGLIKEQRQSTALWVVHAVMIGLGSTMQSVVASWRIHCAILGKQACRNPQAHSQLRQNWFLRHCMR